MVSIDRVERPSASLKGVRDTSARRRAREGVRVDETAPPGTPVAFANLS